MTHVVISLSSLCTHIGASQHLQGPGRCKWSRWHSARVIRKKTFSVTTYCCVQNSSAMAQVQIDLLCSLSTLSCCHHCIVCILAQHLLQPTVKRFSWHSTLLSDSAIGGA